MAAVSCWVSGLPNKLISPNPKINSRSTSAPAASFKASLEPSSVSINRRSILLGTGALAHGLVLSNGALADEIPDRYKAFVDPIDGYSYLYPSDWRDFEFTGCDSAFKDRNVALQHVRVSFVPTEKREISDLGPIDEVVPSLVKNVYAAPTQRPTILDMQERTIDGKKYWTFEYNLQTPTFGRTAFATVAIGNGRYYTLVVGANERRWRRVRSQLSTVADSFRLVDI
ncbi:psbP-like protein 2 [Wolffia australiana]